MSRSKLVCLLPVRNGEEDLPAYLESVTRFADGVIALDDGSTDGTSALLDKHPVVKVLLRNPVRPDYRGWNDSANRNQLLEAADELDPEWIISIDADERIPADDAAALREFIETDALPGCAYGFKVYRMWEGLEQYSRAGLWVYRLFAHERAQRFSNRRLHFVPIPTRIPRARWLRTTIRLQHLGSMTEPRRRERYAKYVQADPNHEFQHSYRDLLEPGGDVRSWEPRAADTGVLAIEGEGQELFDSSFPVLSAIVISQNDEDLIERCVASVVDQSVAWPFEVIVVTSGTDRTGQIVREKFPTVTLVELTRPALPGEARNAGLRLARGDYISFPGSHVELPPGSLTARIRAHDLGYAMVTGTMLNGNTTLAGWASYFLDHSTVLPGRPSQPLTVPPAHCSYRREDLIAVGGFPEDMRTGEDTVVNQRLGKRGASAFRAQDVRLVHHSPCRTVSRLVRHHFQRGRGFGRILLDRYPETGHLLRPANLRSLAFQPVRRLRLTHRNVRAWGGEELYAQYLRVLPLVVAGAVSAWVGMWFEILRPARGKAWLLWGKPFRRASFTARGPAAVTRGRGNPPDQQVTALMYHHLDRPGTRWSVTTEQLEAQVSWLREHGYRSVTVSQLVDAMEGKTSLPAKAVVITNDDGHPETPRFAEILRRHGFVGTYFLPNGTPLSPQKVKALETDGSEIGGHSVNHRDLTRLEAAHILEEILDNKTFLERILGHSVRTFAYPYNASNIDVRTILKEAGYESAVLTGCRPNRLGEPIDRYRISRVEVLGTHTLDEFAAHFRAESGSNDRRGT